MVLPIALLLSRQRQEIRKKASDVSGLRVGNLRASPTSITVGQTINVYVEGTGSDAYGYIEGKVVYESNYFEPVAPNQSLTPLVAAHSFYVDSQLFNFGANNKNALLTGQILKLTLRAKQAGSTSISLGGIAPGRPAKGILLNGSQSLFGSGANGISLTIISAATATPTATPVATVAPDAAIVYPFVSRDDQNSFKLNIDMSFGQLPSNAFVKVYYNSTQVNPASLVNGNTFTTLTQTGNSCSGPANCWIDIAGNTRVAGVTAGGKYNFVRIPFTFTGSAIQTATLRVGSETYVVKQTGGNFTTLSYDPSASISYNRNATPTPTATAVGTATPIVTSTPSPTPTTVATVGNSVSFTATGAGYGLINPTTYRIRLVLNSSPVPTDSPRGDRIRIFAYDPNNPPPGNWVTDPYDPSDIWGPSHCGRAALIPVGSQYIYCSTDINSLDFDLITGGTRRIMVSFFNDFTNPTQLRWSRPVSVDVNVPITTPTPTPTPTASVGGVPGDTNGNGCVGSADVGQVFFKFKGPGTGPNQCNPNDAARTAATADPNGDFNHDGCVNYMDFAIVTSDRFSDSCNE